MLGPDDRVERGLDQPGLADAGLADQQHRLALAGHGLPPALEQSASSWSRPTIGSSRPDLPGLEATSGGRARRGPRSRSPGAAKPLSRVGPRSRARTARPRAAVCRPRSPPRRARPAACSRAARFGVSPTTASSRAAPSPIRSPTTTRPVAMPTRAASGSPAGVDSWPTASAIAEPRAHGPLRIVLVRLRPAEIGQHAVAHELGDVAVPARRPPRRSILIGADDLAACPPDRAAPTARSSRPGRRTAPSAAAARLPQASLWVPPRLERSGTACGAEAGSARAAIASRSLRRCPTVVTPMSLRSSAVSLGRISASISFSRNASS